MSAKLTVKRGTTEKWKDASSNTLAPGQLGVEYLDNGYSRLKVGPNGAITPWGTINYLTPDASLYKDDSIGDSTRSLTSAYIKTLNNLSTVTTYYGTSSYINSLSITNNNIALRVNGSTNGNLTANIGLYSNFLSFHPSGDSQCYIGNPDSHWKVGYIDDINSNSLTTLTIRTGSLLPTYTSANDIGSSSLIWDGIYANNLYNLKTIQTGTLKSLEISNTDIVTTVASLVGNAKFHFDGRADNNPSFYSDFTDNLVMGARSSLGTKTYPWSIFYVKKIGSDLVPDERYTQNLGLDGLPWNSVFTSYIRPGNGSISGLYLSNALEDYYIGPVTDATCNLGASGKRWKNVYAAVSVIQTSDRSAKSNIHYLNDTTNPKKARSISSNSANNVISSEDVLDFIKDLNPATFVYRDEQGNEISEEEASPESIQLGLIADDIKDHKVFKYIGVELDAEKEIEPEEVDTETGEIIKEKVVETYKTLGLQPIPLATAALTACKYLLSKTTYLEDKLNELESRIKTLEQKQL